MLTAAVLVKGLRYEQKIIKKNTLLNCIIRIDKNIT